jgi:phosphoglycolate phosphatase-like HAD superfamily hydrolase
LSLALQRGIKIGVATNLPAWICQPLLEETGLNELVDTVLDASNCKVHKPNGMVLDILLCKLNTDANSAVFAGDSIVDAMTARAAGVRFFWVSYGYEQPNQENAYKVINKFSELLEH